MTAINDSVFQLTRPFSGHSIKARCRAVPFKSRTKHQYALYYHYVASSAVTNAKVKVGVGGNNELLPCRYIDRTA